MKGQKLIKRFINILFSKKEIEEEPGFYRGILIKKPIRICRIQNGFPVITHTGDCGKIIKMHRTFFKPGRTMWFDIRLDNKSYRHACGDSLFAMFIYLPKTDKTYPLSHVCYRYLVPSDEHKVFKFRITNRGYAMLDESFQTERDYVATLRRSRYGASFLDRLNQLNFQIIKK